MSTAVRRFVIAALGVCVMAVPAAARAGDPVMEWNNIARQVIVVSARSAVEQTRAMAIVHVAVHDAVSGITGKFNRYHSTHVAPAEASPHAAAIGAAYRALVGIVGETDFLSTAYATSLATHGISPSDTSLAYGQTVAEAILMLRQDDGSAEAGFPYLPEGAGMPGVWVPMSDAPSAQASLPGWGEVTPWVLRSGSQFRPDAPPALTSERYAKDFNEVYRLGRSTNSTRTELQTQIALFWRASPTALWNPILRRAIESRGLDISATARVAALFYLAAADASVACWDAKYEYDFWRPEPAIVRGDEDDNAATVGDPSWRPLVGTPPHPEYVSGHATNSGAMAGVLTLLFGDAPGFVIEATSPQNEGFVRRWQTFSEGVQEVIDARVYSGIHFRTADVAGARLGRQVAQFVVTHALRPAKGKKGS
jgi:membrane-associated phospholipid phosphatase